MSVRNLLDITENDGVVFRVRVMPRAGQSSIVGLYDGALKVRIAAPPVDGAANAALVALLAKTLKVGRSDVEIVSGASSRNKTVHVAGVSATEVIATLGPDFADKNAA